MPNPGTFTLLEAQVSSRTKWHFLVLSGPNKERTYVGECSDSGVSSARLISLVDQAVAMIGGRPIVQEHAAIREDLRVWVESKEQSAQFAAATVMGAIDQLICDAAARQADMPLWAWLGAPRSRPAAVYANINRMAGARSPETVAGMAAQAVDAGFSAVKCAPFDVPAEGVALHAAGLERVRAVRAAVGDDIDVRVDFHHHLTFDETLELIPALEDLGVSWIEDAVHVTDIESQRALRQATTLPLAGGEQAFSPEMTRAAVAEGLIDILMPDVKHVGGIQRLLDVAASAPHLQISPHNPAGPVATSASAHIFAVCDNASTLEFAFGEVPWRSDLVGGQERITGGMLEVSEKPGLGIEFDLSHPCLTALWSRGR